MTKNPLAAHPDMAVSEVRSIMEKEQIKRMPVLDKNDNLVGIITRKDLLKAGPSQATTLDIYEISYLLSKLKVEKVMERNVITVDENEVVEEAARIMADKGIGALPVMKGSLLVGIITDTDLFRVFINAFGARSNAVRIVIIVPERQGELAAISQAFFEKGGNILSFVYAAGDDPGHARCTMKIEGLSRKDVEDTLKVLGDNEIEDIREQAGQI
jgi:acetoin utilization protein AcuB